MKLLKNKFILVVCSFLLGGASTYFISNYFRMKNELSAKKVARGRNISSETGLLKSKIDADRNNYFPQMDDVFGGSMLGESLFENSLLNMDSFGGLSSGGLKIEEREDDNFKYVEVIADEIDKDSIDIGINDGMISISGEIMRRDENQDQSSRSMSSYISKFSRILKVPYGVSEENMKIDTEDNKIVIKFPKNRI